MAFGIWALKDVLLYPLVWRAYDTHGRSSARPHEGSEGVVLRRLSPSGVVRVDGERWSARALDRSTPLEEGQSVRVVGREGMTLIVEENRGQSP
jgi:membrane-bound ClpP family serine protease